MKVSKAIYGQGNATQGKAKKESKEQEKKNNTVNTDLKEKK